MKKLYFITWITHYSRYSLRMKIFKVPKGDPLELDLDSEIQVTKYVSKIVTEQKYNIHTFNICKDHVHMIIECREEDRDGIVRKLKGKSSYLFHRSKLYKGLKPLVRGRHSQFHLWAQKYYWREIRSDNEYYNVCQYVIQNREKHKLPPSKALQNIINSFTKTKT